MMKLLMANSLSCLMQHWNGHDTLSTARAIDEDDEKDVVEDVYNVATRDDTQPQRAPLQRYMVRYLNGIICYPFGIKYV